MGVRKYVKIVSLLLAVLLSVTSLLPQASVSAESQLNGGQIPWLDSAVPQEESKLFTTGTAIENEERVLITFTDKVDSQIIIEAKGKLKHVFKHGRSVAATITSKEIEKLKKDTRIRSIEPDIVLHAVGQTVDTGIQQIQAPVYWDQGLSGQGIRVAVLDSGIVTEHEDLQVAGGVSFVDYTSSYQDDNGHGTHVAGIVGARDNQVGVVGVAPEVSLYAVKVLDQTGTGYLSDVVAGIDWAIEQQMDIVNLSVSTPVDSEALHHMVDTAYEQGVMVVAAAGNTGMSDGYGDTVQYPARYESVIAVGAVDAQQQRAAFSSTGGSVEVVAPGVSISSTTLGNSYTTMNGTSMAAPFVTGLLALLKQAQPNLTNAQLRTLLQQNTLDIGSPGKDPLYGYGIIKASTSPLPASGNGGSSELTVTNEVYGQGINEEITFDPEGDNDFDGLKNEEEDRLGTSILEGDTDHDGVSDYAELRQYLTNPLSVDSDQDGIHDGVELVDLHTDPLQADENHNGIRDGEEERTVPIKENEMGVTGTATGKANFVRNYGIYKNPYILLDYVEALQKIYVMSLDPEIRFQLSIPISANSKKNELSVYQFNPENGELTKLDTDPVHRNDGTIEVEVKGQTTLVVTSNQELEKMKRSGKGLQKQDLKLVKPKGKMYALNLPGFSFDAELLADKNLRKDKFTGDVVEETNKLVLERKEVDPLTNKAKTLKAYYQVEDVFTDGVDQYVTLQSTSSTTGLAPTILIHGYNSDISAWGFTKVWENRPPRAFKKETAEEYRQHKPSVMAANAPNGLTAAKSFSNQSYSVNQVSDFMNPDVNYIHGISVFDELGPRLLSMGYEANQSLFGFNYRSKYPRIVADAASQLQEFIRYLKTTPNPQKPGTTYIKPNDEINLVTHSTGGVVARYLVENYDNSGLIDRIVAIAPPNYGSEIAQADFLLDGTNAAVDLNRQESCLWQADNYDCPYIANNNTANMQNGTAGTIHTGKTKYFFIGGFNGMRAGSERLPLEFPKALKEDYWVYPSSAQLSSWGYQNYHDYTVDFLSKGGAVNSGEKFSKITLAKMVIGKTGFWTYKEDIDDAVVDVDSAMGSDKDPEFMGPYPFIEATGRYMVFDQAAGCTPFDTACNYGAHSGMRKHPKMLQLVYNLLTGQADSTPLSEDRFDINKASFQNQTTSTFQANSVLGSVYGMAAQEGAYGAEVSTNVYGQVVANQMNAAAIGGSSSTPIVVNSRTPVISWIQSNMDGTTTFTGYEIAVYDSSGTEVWFSGERSQNTTAKIGSGMITQALSNGSLYQITVSVKDINGNWSRPSGTIWIKVDTSAAPTPWPGYSNLQANVTMASLVGTQNSPYNTTSRAPTITWSSNKAFSQYIVKVLDLGNYLIASSGIKTAGSSTGGSWTVPQSLQPNGTYKITVTVFDGTEWSNQTNGQNVTWIRVPGNQNPTMTMTYPASEGSYGYPQYYYGQLPFFTWEQRDPDQGTIFTSFRFTLNGIETVDTGFILEPTYMNQALHGIWTYDRELPQSLINRPVYVAAMVHDGLMHSIPKYFWINVVDSIPSATLTGPTEYDTTQPVITWSQADGDGVGTLKKYQIQIFNQDGTVKYVDSGEVTQISPTGAMSWKSTGKLPENQMLKLRIRVSDGITWSNWSERSITITLDANPSLLGNNVPWIKSNEMAISNTAAKDGNASLHFNSTTLVPVSISSSGFIEVSPNTTYTLSGWLSNSLSSGGVIYMDWSELDSANNLVVDGSEVIPTGTNLWEYGSKTFTTSATTTKVGVRVVVYNAMGNAFADGIKLVEGKPSSVYESSFESGQYSWTKSHLNVLSIQDTHAKDGTNGLQFAVNAPEVIVATSGLIQVKPNTTYTLSGWLSNSLSSGGVIYMDWSEYDPAYSLIKDGSEVVPTGKNAWEYGNKTFTTGATTTSLEIRLVVHNGTGLAFADGIKLKEGAPSVLYEASFERGQYSWNISHPSVMSIQSTHAKDGANGLQLNVGAPEVIVGTSGLIQVKPNTTYTLSGWLSNSLSSGGVLYMDWNEFDNAYNLLVDGLEVMPTGKNQWEYGSKTFTTGVTTTSLQIRLVVHNGTGLAFADGVKLKEGAPSVLYEASFERGQYSWNISHPSVMSIQSTHAKDGANGLQLNVGAPEVIVGTSGLIQVKPNTTYTLSGWLSNSLSSGGVLYMDWNELDSLNNLVVDGSEVMPTGKNQWEYGSKTFTTGVTTTSLQIRLVVHNGTGYAFADGIKLTEGTPSILYESSFEPGQYTWNISHPSVMSIQSTHAKDGENGLQLNVGAPEVIVGTSGLIQVKPNTTYTLSGWLSNSLSSGGGLYMDWNELDSSNNLVVDGSEVMPTGKNQWEYGSKTFTTSATTTGLHIRLVVYNGTGQAFADGIKLYQSN